MSVPSEARQAIDCVRLRFILLENLPAIVERPNDEAETFLVTDLNVAVASNPLSDGRVEPFDLIVSVTCQGIRFGLLRHVLLTVGSH